jgi:hypothetical protein
MMDSTHFDTLVRVLASRRPRRAALPLLAVLGFGLAREETSAKKTNNHEKEIRICVCADANPSTCKTQKKEKDKAKKTLRRNVCAYRGRCQSGVSGCATLAPVTTNPPNPGFQCTNNNDCTGGLVCIRQTCQACSDTGQCSGNQVCLNGTCQNPGPGPGPVCPAQCPFCQQCNAATGQCEVCPGNCGSCFTLLDRSTVCGDGGTSDCSATCTTATPCPAGQHCVVSVTNLFTNVTRSMTDICQTNPFICTVINPCT